MEVPASPEAAGRFQRKAKRAAKKKREALKSADKRLTSGAELDLKIILVGNSAVGKTSLLARFLDETANIARAEGTVLCDFSHCVLRLGGRTVQLRLWDTGGMERFNATKDFTQSFYSEAHGAMLVFSVSDLTSFSALPQWLERVRRGVRPAGRQFDCCLVGNKCDADSGSDGGAGRRLVSRREAQRLANELGYPYIETSAVDVVNVQKAFIDLTLAIMRRVASSSSDAGGSGTPRMMTSGSRGEERENSKSAERRRLRDGCVCS